MTTANYKLDVGLEEILAASSTDPVAAGEIRRAFADDLDRDRLGVGARLEGEQIRFAFPIAIVVRRKPSLG